MKPALFFLLLLIPANAGCSALAAKEAIDRVRANQAGCECVVHGDHACACTPVRKVECR